MGQSFKQRISLLCKSAGIMPTNQSFKLIIEPQSTLTQLKQKE